jgi:hypothetical protein
MCYDARMRKNNIELPTDPQELARAYAAFQRAHVADHERFVRALAFSDAFNSRLARMYARPAIDAVRRSQTLAQRRANGVCGGQ